MQQLLSFDIWDTVLRRNCAPDEDKLAVARYLLLCRFEDLQEEYRSLWAIHSRRKAAELKLALQNQEKGLDDEYSAEDVFSEMLGEILIDPENVVGLTEKLMEVEIRQVGYVTYLEKEVVPLIGGYPNLPKVYISDFYLGKKQLDTILEQYVGDVRFDNGYVSCDYLLNKKSSRLYQVAETDNHVLPQNHIHYGDSKHADLTAAKKLGIQAYLFTPKASHQSRQRLERNFEQRKQGNTKAYFDFMKDWCKETGESDTVRCGRYFSLIFYCFVLEIIETAIQRKTEKVYYFSREGEFFSRIHKEIRQHNASEIEIPDCEVLEVSRMATFAPSLYDFSPEELKRLWTQYHDQSMESFYRSLNIPIGPYEEYFRKYSIWSEEVIPNIAEDPRVVKLLADRKFVDAMKEETARKRESLKGYLAEKGIDPSTQELFVVDIGWRGSIQDNLALVLPDTHIFGYYLGLYNSFYGNISNSEKKGFMSDRRTPEFMWCLKYVDPVEMYTNSANGSTTGYKKTENSFVAVKENYQSEDDIFHTYTGAFQKGVLEMVPRLCGIVDTFSLTSDEFKEVALRRLEELIGFPDKSMAAPYFRLSHNENFGKGAVERKNAEFNFAVVLRVCSSRANLRKLVRGIEDTHWPQGLLRCNGLGFLLDCYNSIARKRYRKQRKFTDDF